MYSVDLYSRVRRACHVEGMSKSEAARVFNIDRKTVGKILKRSVLPGYRRSKPPACPKRDPFIPIIDQILEADRAQVDRLQGLMERLPKHVPEGPQRKAARKQRQAKPI